MIYVWDLDHTLCVPTSSYDTYERYALATPIEKNIAVVRRLYAIEGNKIIIHTARRMVTHDNNVQKVILDVGNITQEWLKNHECPYHELVFGKPYGDFYIDDKAINLDGIENL